MITLAIFSLLSHSGDMISIAALSRRFVYGIAFAQDEGLSKVIFMVKCYDEGETALRGLRGIQKIEPGFYHVHEIDTVYYDPKLITMKGTETVLKKAGTYLETITKKEGN